LASEVGDRQRRLVAERAGFRCEYCLLSEDDSFSGHQIDHILSLKHGGSPNESNLAYSCVRCNAWKGTDIAAIDAVTGKLVPLFDPRRNHWEDHFRLDGLIIEPLTAEGRVTARLLRLNIEQRIVERRLLIAIGRYPGKLRA
jgi:hypothetical protein